MDRRSGRGTVPPITVTISVQQPPSAPTPAPPSSERLRLLDVAIKAWKNQLVDLTARNNLLYFRDLKVGTLDFTGKGNHVDRLLSGGEITLARIFSEDTPRTAFAKRARTIRSKAKELLEERGLESLFLAHGLATWDEEDEERRLSPAAPVVLVPVSLEPVAQDPWTSRCASPASHASTRRCCVSFKRGSQSPWRPRSSTSSSSMRPGSTR
jgi:hypothetical protein